MSLYQLQSTPQEAFVRLGQTKDRGCLVVFSAHDAIHIFVHDGAVIHAAGAKLEGELAVAFAMKLDGAAYGWIAGAEPPTKDVRIEIPDFVQKHALVHDPRMGKTIRLPPMQVMPDKKKQEFQYFLVPEDSPTTRLKVRKLTNVVGRDSSSDISINSYQVSRRHCLLQVTDRGLLVKDLESTNGTYVNGIPLVDGYINDGDRLSLGTYKLSLHREKI